MNEMENARVTLLLQQRRYADAESALREMLARDPDNAAALLLLGVTLLQLDRKDEALTTILAAQHREPDSDRIHAWKARLLLAKHRVPEALEAAEHAIGLDPHEPFNWTTRGAIHAERRAWPEAEADARQALTLDPGDSAAHNLLSSTLLFQGRSLENEANISVRLAEDPNSPVTHTNAGYAALRRGDHRKAAEHFAEALRADASFEAARDGLIESFRARSAFYRAWLAFSFRMAAFSEKYGTMLLIGLYIAYRLLRSALEQIDQRLAVGLGILWLCFAFWSFVARGLSTFFLLTDRFARTALRPREKAEALLVGGAFVAGILQVVLAFLISLPQLAVIGGALIVQAIPASLYFMREEKPGRILFGSLTLITWTCAAVVIAATFTTAVPEGLFGPALTIGLVAAIGSTWLAMFGVAKR